MRGRGKKLECGRGYKGGFEIGEINAYLDNPASKLGEHQFVPVRELIGEGDGREKILNTKWPLLRGRLQGGGDPRVACRGQAGERMRQQDDVWKVKVICGGCRN